ALALALRAEADEAGDLVGDRRRRRRLQLEAALAQADEAEPVRRRGPGRQLRNGPAHGLLAARPDAFFVEDDENLAPAGRGGARRRGRRRQLEAALAQADEAEPVRRRGPGRQLRNGPAHGLLAARPDAFFVEDDENLAPAGRGGARRRGVGREGSGEAGGRLD